MTARTCAVARTPPAVVLLVAACMAACTPSTSGPVPPSPPVDASTTAAPSSSSPPPASATATAPPDAALPTAIPLPVTPTSRLRIGLDRDPSSLDPARAIDDGALLVVDAVFDSLTRMSDDLTRVLPAAAESWSVSDDGLVWTFRLREAAWHDGLPVSASQFARAFSHVATDAAGAEPFHAHLLAPIRGWGRSQRDGVDLLGVRVIDSQTLEITLDGPFADLPALVSHPALAPRRRAGVDAEQPVGNGPFRMDDAWAHNQFIRVTAVPDHLDSPRVSEVVFPIYAGGQSDALQLEDFRAGVLDVAQVPPLELADVRMEYGESVDGYRGPGLLEGVGDEAYWMGFNTQVAPFDDPEVRMGISQLLDRDRIIEVYTASSRTRATGIVPAGLPGSAAIDCAACRHDPQNAQLALADFTERLDEPVRILTVDGVTNLGIANTLATAIREATGAIVIVDAVPPGQWLTQVRTSDIQVFRAGWEASWPTMGGVLAPSFHSSEVGADNLVRLDDGQVDAAIDRALELGGSAAIPAWQEAEQRVADLAAVVPVYWYQLNTVVADRVQGFTLSPTGQVDLSGVVVTEP